MGGPQPRTPPRRRPRLWGGGGANNPTRGEVWRLYGDAVAQALYPSRPLPLFVEGEEDKQLDAVDRLVSELVVNRVHRREKLVLLGGGVCCDLGGLVALIYMRGMDYAIVP